jgi:hypothetical protein
MSIVQSRESWAPVAASDKLNDSSVEEANMPTGPIKIVVADSDKREAPAWPTRISEVKPQRRSQDDILELLLKVIE